MRVISFKIWGDYAHFRRHYTTSSPLTHSIPPPSALRGIVGAIMGLSRDEYTEKLSPQTTKLGVRLLRPVKKIRWGINYMDTKDGSWVQLNWKTLRPVVKRDGHGNFRLHTQVRVELLKDPAFVIFFHHKDNRFMDEFAERLREHRTVYTPYLGITECLANFEFMWDENVEIYSGVAEVTSAFTITNLKELKLKEGTGMVKEKLPVFINNERIRLVGEEVVFNPYGKPILAELKNSFLCPGEDNRTFAFIG